MSEWWTYTLSDFLLFSAQTYHRLFELYNRAIWPAQLVAFALGIVILWCLLRGLGGGARRGKLVAAILAAGWMWVAWAFHVERYATINWAANYFAAGFVVEALLLLWIGVVRAELPCPPPRNGIDVTGLCLFLFALLVQPLIRPVTGRPWSQMEIFGVAPDPTVIATLGILLLASNRVRWGLMPVPVVWCVISGATLWTMGSQDAWIMPLAALLVLLLAVRKTRTWSAK